MIRELFLTLANYKTSIVLSFKPREKTSNQPKVRDKRKPITFSQAASGGKKRRDDRQEAALHGLFGKQGKGSRAQATAQWTTTGRGKVSVY